MPDPIDATQIRINGLYNKAIYHEGLMNTTDDPRMKDWHKRQMERKLDQIYWAEMRLEFLLAEQRAGR